jgi:hypothetical protein
MSKNTQRRISYYAQGRHDARTGFGIRWIRHPYMAEYMRGFNSWKKPKRTSWLARLINIICEGVTGRWA